jgi:hypothetical protein
VGELPLDHGAGLGDFLCSLGQRVYPRHDEVLDRGGGGHIPEVFGENAGAIPPLDDLEIPEGFHELLDEEGYAFGLLEDQVRQVGKVLRRIVWNVMVRWIRGALAALLLLAAIVAPGAAVAADFRLGPVEGLFDVILSYGLAVRVEDRDERIIAAGNGGDGDNANIDDGNLNYLRRHFAVGSCNMLI